ncbi:MAG: carcinine hydrolase/isopenicillin-N N-acyltransferase family protein [Gemmataceae bacterium]
MGRQAIVALGQATVDGSTLFAHTMLSPPKAGLSWVQIPGRAFAWGEKVRTQHLDIPQARQTYTVFGSRPAGAWGLTHGVNEHQLAAGCTCWHSKIRGQQDGLVGTDLVRLSLERARNARQAVDVVAHLLEEYGPHAASSEDAILLLADPQEALVIECAGPFWVCQEIRQMRVVGDTSVIRQDWDRISPGLACYAIEQGWWPGDGNKLDFGTVGLPLSEEASVWRWWGQSTRWLEEQQGRIDLCFLRRLERRIAQTLAASPASAAASAPSTMRLGHSCMVARLTADAVAPEPVWAWIGSLDAGIYFPFFWQAVWPEPAPMEGGQPASLADWWQELSYLHELLLNDGTSPLKAAAALSTMQEQVDQKTAEFLEELAGVRPSSASLESRRQCDAFLQHLVEELEHALAITPPHRGLTSARRDSASADVFIAG